MDVALNSHNSEITVDIAVEKLCVTLGPREILKDISFSVQPGEIITVVGPNGSGKTTLLRALLGLIQPTHGHIHHAADLTIGYMPQRLALEKTLPLTVKRFLELGPKLCHEILEWTHLSPLLHRPVHVLSGGEMQRVLLARALMGKPRCLILDEPLQGVDISAQSQFYEWLLKARETWGCSIVMVSHDLYVVMAKTDRVICINQHICCQGTPEFVQRDPAFLNLFGEVQSFAWYHHIHDHTHEEH